MPPMLVNRNNVTEQENMHCRHDKAMKFVKKGRPRRAGRNSLKNRNRSKLVVLYRADLHQTVEIVDGFHVADGAGLPTDDH